MKFDKLQEPLNAEERYLHGVNIRLNIIIDMLSSIVGFIANQNNVAVTENKIVEDVEIEDVEIEEVVVSKKRRTKK